MDVLSEVTKKEKKFFNTVHFDRDTPMKANFSNLSEGMMTRSS